MCRSEWHANGTRSLMKPGRRRQQPGELRIRPAPNRAAFEPANQRRTRQVALRGGSRCLRRTGSDLSVWLWATGHRHPEVREPRSLQRLAQLRTVPRAPPKAAVRTSPIGPSVRVAAPFRRRAEDASGRIGGADVGRLGGARSTADANVGPPARGAGPSAIKTQRSTEPSRYAGRHPSAAHAHSASRSAETDAVAVSQCVAGAISRCPAYTVSRCRRTDGERKRDGWA